MARFRVLSITIRQRRELEAARDHDERPHVLHQEALGGILALARQFKAALSRCQAFAENLCPTQRQRAARAHDHPAASAGSNRRRPAQYFPQASSGSLPTSV